MEGFLAALGHSFFTLSLGMAIMTTYGSYVPDDGKIIKSALSGILFFYGFLINIFKIKGCFFLEMG